MEISVSLGLVPAMTIYAVGSDEPADSLVHFDFLCLGLLETRTEKEANNEKGTNGKLRHDGIQPIVSKPVSVPPEVLKRSISRPKFCSMERNRLQSGTELLPRRA